MFAVLAQPAQAGNHETGQIAVFKTMCESIGEQDVCNGRDTTLNNYMVDFEIYEGAGTDGELVETVTVTLSENAQGGGNLGDGSQGRIVSGELEVGTYTVCEIPVAYTLGEGGVRTDEVDLDAVPRPEAGNGGSTGGQQDQIEGTDCVIVEVTASGTAEVKFLDTVAEDEEPAELGSLLIAKENEAGALLGGATFTVDGVVYADADGDGFVCLDGLTLGDSVTVIETIAPEGFILDPDDEQVEITSTEDCATRLAAEGAQADADVTFVNVAEEEELGSITIIKDADPNSARDFAFTVTGTGLTAFSLDDDANATLSNQIVFTGLAAGTFTVTEAMVAGWTLSDLDCTAGGVIDLTNRTATITLAAGADVTCTFVNEVTPEGELPNVVQRPREGTRGGNPTGEGTLPNTATAPVTGSLPAIALALVMLTGLGAAGYAMSAEARRRR